jgi:hypothetical protein
MSPPFLAQELLDHIADYLHDDRESLQGCSLVSKSWVSRTRKHLFAYVTFRTGENLQLWKHMFPDPLSSPGHHTRFLCISSVYAVLEDKGASWIQAFSNVHSFKVYTGEKNLDIPGVIPFISLVPFHGFSAALESLTIGIHDLPCEEVLEFILSFPLLKDLDVIRLGDQGEDLEEDQMNLQIPSAFPPLSGTLDLTAVRDNLLDFSVNKLLKLPNGIHFKRLRLWHRDIGDASERNVAAIRDLIDQCSPTLKDLCICFDGGVMQHLSTVTFLRLVSLLRDLKLGGWKCKQLFPRSLHGKIPGIFDTPSMGIECWVGHQNSQNCPQQSQNYQDQSCV